jgi:hypothetical protein
LGRLRRLAVAVRKPVNRRSEASEVSGITQGGLVVTVQEVANRKQSVREQARVKDYVSGNLAAVGCVSTSLEGWPRCWWIFIFFEE